MPEWVQIGKIIWHYSNGISEQPTVDHDRDKSPASPGIELGQFIKIHSNMVYFIMICKKSPFPSFVQHIMSGI